jgi:hypothetical protein
MFRLTLKSLRSKKSIDTKKIAITRQWTLLSLSLNFTNNLLTKVYHDNLSTGSFKSGGGDHPLPTALFFQYVSVRVPTPIGEPTLSDEYRQVDKKWDFWMTSTNPNSHRLTDHDKHVVESLNDIIRHQNAAAALLKQLLEHNQGNDTDEDIQVTMV